MICIAIAQESRRMALADMLNASRQCDLIELRLDRFGKAPEIGELLAKKPKPVILSCRRPSDGGEWAGTEDERLAVLRQCIIAKADYVEIELDVADQIRPFPGSKRVIAYTNLEETPDDLLDIYAQAKSKSPDVIKLTTLARTPEEAWPLVQLLAKATVPTVVVGLGKPGVLLTVLGRKFGAPWVYAALEKGMEAYPDQPTIHDLHAIYRYQEIDKQTRFVGVTGFGELERTSCAVLNSALAQAELVHRCLPLTVGSVPLFRKVIEAAKLGAVVVDEAERAVLYELAGEAEPFAKQLHEVDFLLHSREKNMWFGQNTFFHAVIHALETTLKHRSAGAQPLKGRQAVVVGMTPLAKVLSAVLVKQGVAVILASRDRAAAQQHAQQIGCRFVTHEAMYTTSHELLLVCADEPPPGKGERLPSGIHPGYLTPGHTVLDVTKRYTKSELLKAAEKRGANIVLPRQLFMSQLHRQAKLLTGKEVASETLSAVFNAQYPEEAEREE